MYTKSMLQTPLTHLNSNDYNLNLRQSAKVNDPMFEFIGKEDSQNGRCWNQPPTNIPCKKWMDTLLDQTIRAMKYAKCYDVTPKDGLLDFTTIGLVSNDTEIRDMFEQEMKNLVSYQKQVRAQLKKTGKIPRGQKPPLDFKVRRFYSKNYMEAYLKSSTYTTKKFNGMCFGLIIYALPDDKGYNIEIMMNDHLADRQQQTIPFQQLPAFDNLVGSPQMHFFDQYTQGGFSIIQNWVANFVLRKNFKTSNGQKPTITHLTIPMNADAYNDDQFAQILGILAFFMFNCYLVPLYRLTYRIVNEKETRARESMKMMGLTDTSYWLSWFTYYLCIVTIISLISTYIVKDLIKTDKSIFFVTVWLFGMSQFGFALIFQSLFDKARTAAGVTLTMYFMLSFFDSLVRDGGSSYYAKTMASLITSVAQNRMFFIMSVAEKSNGLNWTNINYEYQNYVFRDGLIVMFISTILLIIIGLYLDNVVQQSYGTAKPYLFFMDKNFWGLNKGDAIIKPQETSDLEENTDAEDFWMNKKNYEPVTSHELLQQQRDQKMLRISGLKKRFGDFNAVNGVNLKMYSGQIFALLGHNGAGKTTTISMLTGLITSTEGRCHVFGKDLFGQMADVRKFMGVCPQHDVLFDLLTPQEHLDVFCDFKGVDITDKQEQIDKMLTDIDLNEKKDCMAEDLSGGNRRKLSVAIALIGDSKFILLDEPTAGMDLSARRKLWDMLKKYKGDKIIILTTHYMDEADILGDRIGIMCNGQITCLGRSLFLKNRFGVGYRLNVVKKTKDQNTTIKPFLQEQLGDSVQKLSEISSEITFQIPKHFSDKFKDFFDKFDQNIESLGVASYGISVTTLEEVFLRVGHGIEDEEEDNTLAKTVMHDKEEEQEDEIDKYTIESQDGSYNYTEQIGAIIRRRIQSYQKSPASLLFEIIVPVLLIAFGLAFSKVEFMRSSQGRVLEPSLWSTQNLFYNTKLISSGDITPLDIVTNLPKREELITLNPYENPTTGNKTKILEDMSTKMFDERISEIPYRFGSYFILGADNRTKVFQLATFVNASSQDATAYYPSFLYEATLRAALGRPDYIFNVTNSPFPVSQKLASRAGSASAIMICMIAGIGFALIPASTVSNIVTEKEKGLKHMQIVSGLSLGSYWVANFIFDVVKTFLPCILTVGVIYMFDMGYEYAWATILMFPLGVVPYSYAISFLFTTESTAQTVVLFSNIIAGSIGGMAVFILRMIPDTMEYGDMISKWLKIIPTYAISNSIIYDGSKTSFNMTRTFGQYQYPDLPNITLEGWDLGNVGGDMLAMGIHLVFGLSVVIIIEIGAFRFVNQISKWKQSQVTHVTSELQADEDVINEEKRVAKIKPEDCLVRIDQLRKVYTAPFKEPVIAIESCGFSIDKGECFALLGTNGSGKTTTFKSLTQGVVPSSGSITIKGYDVQKDFNSARQFIGYCPQHDTIFETLTVMEHLQYISVVKRLPIHMRQEMCKRAVHSLNLGEYTYKEAGQLSGGNKRKLSVAMALLGNPPIVLLDEPSAGMDPQARRFMWDIISKVSQKKKSSGVIISTHSMEEAEALSTKMGILVKGGIFRCFGSSQHVKNKFGTGYEIEVKFKLLSEKQIEGACKMLGIDSGSGRKDLEQVKLALTQAGVDQYVMNELESYGSGGELVNDQQNQGAVQVSQVVHWLHTELCGLAFIKFLVKEFKQVEVLEHVADFYKLRVPRGDTTIGYTFGTIEHSKHLFNISEYAASQTTLEQIFASFAKETIAGHADKEVFTQKDSNSDVLLNKTFSKANIEQKDMIIEQKSYFNTFKKNVDEMYEKE